MWYLRKRFSIAAGVATPALLALPSLASANPGTGPELVQRSGRLVVVHADRADGTSSEQWTLVNGASHVRVRAPDDVWITPGTPVRLEGTMVGGTLVSPTRRLPSRRPASRRCSPPPGHGGRAGDHNDGGDPRDVHWWRHLARGFASGSGCCRQQ